MTMRPDLDPASPPACVNGRSTPPTLIARGRAGIAAAVAALAVLAGPAHAADPCATRPLGKAAPTLASIYAIAEGHAKAWQPDVVPARLSNTTLGPLKPDGSSDAWYFGFYSAKANASLFVSTANGYIACSVSSGPAGRLPDLKADFVRDGAKLYAIARQHGEAEIGRGYMVMIQTAAAPSNRHATWYINYSGKDNKDAKLIVIVDANTGAVEKVLRD
jgi:hypothetical protein